MRPERDLGVVLPGDNLLNWEQQFSSQAGLFPGDRVWPNDQDRPLSRIPGVLKPSSLLAHSTGFTAKKPY